MCSAAVIQCVCVRRIRVRVRTCHTTSPSSSVPAVQIPSITCVCIISYVCMRLQLRGCFLKQVFVSFSTLHPTPAYNVTRAHIVITPCGLPRQVLLFPLQGTKCEHAIGDILRLKEKVADLIVLHVTAGRAISVADLQRQCSGPKGRPPLRLLMGNRAHMGFDILDAVDNINLEAHLRQSFFPHRRYLSLGVLKHSATPDDCQVPYRAASHQSSVTKTLLHLHKKTLTKHVLLFCLHGISASFYISSPPKGENLFV